MALTFSPSGLSSIKTLTGSAWCGQVNEYFIQSGYAQNIFRGDPVTIKNGYIVSMFGQKAGTPVLGIFDGCSYRNLNAQDSADPANPGRPYFPSGTRNAGDEPVSAYIIDDPAIIYSIQSNNGGVAWSEQGLGAQWAFANKEGQVLGNFALGTSLAYLNSTTIAQDNPQFVIKRFAPVEFNKPDFKNPDTDLPHAIVEVVLENTLL
jgi:hypothetical protein